VSKALRRSLCAAGVPHDRLWIAPAFFLDALGDRITPAGAAALRRRHSPLCAAVAAPGPEYGMDVLLDAFAALRRTRPEAGLVVAGPDLRRAERTRPGVYWLGDLPRAETLGLLEACDVFIRPTRADGDAISVREALALGRRVVASDAAARPEGVALHRAGDAGDLARAVLAALDAPPPQVLVDQGREAVLAAYRQLGLPLGPSPSERIQACAG
jgi:glycosyltransferase involved in cell wall biosynthesis